MNPEEPDEGPTRPRYAATKLESVEEIRKAARRPATAVEARSAIVPRSADGLLASPGDRSSASPAETQAFRPLARPPLALLSVFDDGDTQGELVRVRTSSFVIGRADGDFLVPHDTGMSTRHAELVRRLEDGQYRWSLRDLQSTNGTFVRVSGSVLKHGQEMLLGGVRLRFEAATSSSPAGPAEGTPVASTQKWQVLPNAGRASAPAPGLVILTPQGEGRRYPLVGEEIRIGRDPTRCTIVLDHPMVCPWHASIRRDQRGRWSIHNERSLNGLWITIDEIPLDRGGQFQCGEQRFQVRIL